MDLITRAGELTDSYFMLAENPPDFTFIYLDEGIWSSWIARGNGYFFCVMPPSRHIHGYWWDIEEYESGDCIATSGTVNLDGDYPTAEAAQFACLNYYSRHLAV